jgi:hypothetical protein
MDGSSTTWTSSFENRLSSDALKAFLIKGNVFYSVGYEKLGGEE